MSNHKNKKKDESPIHAPKSGGIEPSVKIPKRLLATADSADTDPHQEILDAGWRHFMWERDDADDEHVGALHFDGSRSSARRIKQTVEGIDLDGEFTVVEGDMNHFTLDLIYENAEVEVTQVLPAGTFVIRQWPLDGTARVSTERAETFAILYRPVGEEA